MSADARPVILQVLTRMGAGGPPLFVLLVHRGIEAYGYRTLLAVGSCYAADQDMSYILQPGDSVVRIPEMWRPVSPWRDAVALWKLFRLIRTVKPDIVQTHTAKAGALGRLAAWLAGAPVVVHTFHGNVLNNYFSPPVNWLIQQVERLLARLADVICVLSPQQAEEMAVRYRIAPRRKLRVVPLGTDLEPFAGLAAPPAQGWLTVGWLGRLVPIKDVPLLLSIVRLAAARSAPVRFLVAGDGPEREAVVQAAGELGAARIEYLGWQKEVASVLARCHLLIQTSRNEGTPLALIQGMAAGRPFVSTPAGGVVDMMSGPGREDAQGCRWHANGVLAPARAEAFLGALERLAAEPGLLGDMSEASRVFASRNYSDSRLLSDLDSLYRGLIHRHGHSGDGAAWDRRTGLGFQ